MNTETAAKTTDKPRSKAKKGFFNSLNSNLAIDLGTANTLIYLSDKGVVLNEPSIVALDPSGKIIAVGIEAQQMHEKTHKNIKTVRPLKGGVIADFDIAEKMMREMIRKVMKKRWFASVKKMLVTVPNGITAVERMAVRDSAENAGAKEVFLIEETIAAAVGMGLNVNEPIGNMIVDIGGGTTEIAIISLSGIVHAQSVRIGGEKMNEEIVNFIRRKHNLLIGERTAEKIKMTVGSAYVGNDIKEMKISGRDLVTGLPKTMCINELEIKDALYEPVKVIVENIKNTLERTPPELASDIMETGIMLTGGGALLSGLDELIRRETEMPANIAENPLDCVALGTGKAIETLDEHKRVFVSTKRNY